MAAWLSSVVEGVEWRGSEKKRGREKLNGEEKGVRA